MSSKRLCSVVILLLNLFLVESTIFVTDYNHMIEITANNVPCRLLTDRNYINSIISKTNPKRVFEVPPQTLQDVSRSCQDSDSINRTGGYIFPGTKWCGPGTIAKSYDDLGTDADVDRCCREHDFCPNHLEPGQCKRGVCNISPYTRSHCSCDETFRSCLQNVKSHTANLLGSIYFNVAQVTCFKERRDCTQSLRDNLSYSWFCEEWKFVPSKNFVASIIETNKTQSTNEIPDDRRSKPEEHSKIDRDLETIFGNDDEITKIMNDYKTLRN